MNDLSGTFMSWKLSLWGEGTDPLSSSNSDKADEGDNNETTMQTPDTKNVGVSRDLWYHLLVFNDSANGPLSLCRFQSWSVARLGLIFCFASCLVAMLPLLLSILIVDLYNNHQLCKLAIRLLGPLSNPGQKQSLAFSEARDSIPGTENTPALWLN